MFVKFLFLPPFEKKNFVELRADKTKKTKNKKSLKKQKNGRGINPTEVVLWFCGLSDLDPKFPYEPRKKPSYFPLYWLVNRDPYNGLL